MPFTSAFKLADALSRSPSWKRESIGKAKVSAPPKNSSGNREMDPEEEAIMVDVELALKEKSLNPSNKQCPECHRDFCLITIREIEIECCRMCHSFWFDGMEFKQFTGMLKNVPSDHLKSRPSAYACPVCQGKMKESVFLAPANLLVNHCPSHGVYLEDGEMERVFEII